MYVNVLPSGKNGGLGQTMERPGEREQSICLVGDNSIDWKVGHSKDTEKLESKGVGYGRCYQTQLC